MRKSKRFFFEKKNQKTFGYSGCGFFGWASPDLRYLHAWLYDRSKAGTSSNT